MRDGLLLASLAVVSLQRAVQGLKLELALLLRQLRPGRTNSTISFNGLIS